MLEFKYFDLTRRSLSLYSYRFQQCSNKCVWMYIYMNLEISNLKLTNSEISEISIDINLSRSIHDQNRLS